MNVEVGKQSLALTKGEEDVLNPKQRAQHGNGKNVKLATQMKCYQKIQKTKESCLARHIQKEVCGASAGGGTKEKEVGASISQCSKKTKDVISFVIFSIVKEVFI